MSTERRPTPRLLVSVRSASEAEAAADGGADLLDVKNPAAGPLGMADAGAIAAVCRIAAERGLPVSVALGELDDWPDDRPVPPLPPAVAFAKLGLHGERNRTDWPRRWSSVRRRFNAAAGRPLDWAAVLYADAAAAAPEPAALLDRATTTGCRAFLVDTFAKNGRRLLDHVSLDRLAAWRESAAEAGLTFALAGSLCAGDWPRLRTVGPDIVAVRGAACREGDRAGTIDAAAVRRLRSVLASTL